ncbi:MAG: transglutaminase domain-containing protein [Chloroflexi bacterium]|nr:transglutaminase domain-containing protein [Chloroflexota bacterium]
MSVATPLDFVLEGIHKIPNELRTFSVDARAARFLYGIKGADQELLRQLPSQEVEGRPLYDSDDLNNLALYLGLPSLQRQAMQSWAAALQHIARGRANFTVGYATMAAGIPGKRPLELLLPFERRQTEVAELGTIVTSFNWQGPLEWSRAPERVHELLQWVASLDFFMMPWPLCITTEFARRNHILDCTTASLLLLEECQAAGIEARRRFGVLLAEPAGTLHFWTEVCVEGVWTPFDPLILRTLQRHAGLDPVEWPIDRSDGGLLMPLADDLCPVLLDGGEERPVSFVVEQA